ncbi:Hypothetical_protein [Hexamita inflata]|uniref:Hypothetical_protein n=1 Tax=Hexamita inflata TaxID=28002 RepID=A0ABP1GUI1_9EUKA
MQNNKTQTQILCSQYIVEDSLLRVNEPEQEETDQRVMTLFSAVNLEALCVAADTLVPRFILAISKIVTKITSGQQCQFKLVQTNIIVTLLCNQVWIFLYFVYTVRGYIFSLWMSSSLSLPFSAVCVDFFLVFFLWAFSKFFSVY